MNNNDCRSTKQYVFRITTFLLIFFVSATGGVLYPYENDIYIEWPEWASGSEEINLDVPVPLLGKGKFSSIWVNTLGALTYNQLMDPRFESLVNNIAIAPFFARSREGAFSAVSYRQTKDDDALFKQIQEDIVSSLLLPPSDDDIDVLDFKPTYALVVTWHKVASIEDTELVNTFQIVLTTDGTRSFAIYNYDDQLAWSSASGIYAAAGLFVVTEYQAVCSYAFPQSQTDTVSFLGSTLGNNGKPGRFVLIISEPLKCSYKFESQCAALPTAEWGYVEPYFSIDGNSWDVYALHTCDEGFSILPGVVTERIDCSYDPDYYLNTWSKDTTKCIDFNATRSFDIVTEVTSIGGDNIIWFDELRDENSTEFVQLKNIVEKSITKLLNYPDVTVVVTSFSDNTTRPTMRSETTTSIQVGITMYVPTYIHKKLTAEEIETRITTELLENDEQEGVTFVPIVTVEEKTDKCLQGCLCRNRKDPKLCARGGKLVNIQPDSCCGGCNGKPYSSTIKACCNNEHLYDPTKARCCNGRVRKGAGAKCP